MELSSYHHHFDHVHRLLRFNFYFQVGVSHAKKALLKKTENPKTSGRGLIVSDGTRHSDGGALGTSSGTAYLESASGIEVGGRTGLTPVFTAFLFLPTLSVFSPFGGDGPSLCDGPRFDYCGRFDVSWNRE